ncbi:hypothetical protein ACDY96_00060 [Rhizobium mongolense]|uniref:hypothetical protein n=1 Tax=Rhizobium mongolense TaxID=57676 RepID=UPI003558F9BC
MALVLRKFAPPRNGKPVYHFAPETAIADILLEKYDSDYRPADYEPELYSWSKVPVAKVDLSKPRNVFSKASVRGFVHSHVLEHIPGSIERIISEMNEAIEPGGFHLFQVPIEQGWYREDMNPHLSREERERIFKQDDHLRVFGDQDFDDRCLRLFSGFKQIDLRREITGDALEEAVVPRSTLTRYNGHTAFMFIKR